MKELPIDDQKKKRKELVMKKFVPQECAICMCALGHEPWDQEVLTGSVFKTPCKHVFHKTCLKDWLEHKH